MKAATLSRLTYEDVLHLKSRSVRVLCSIRNDSLTATKQCLQEFRCLMSQSLSNKREGDFSVRAAELLRGIKMISLALLLLSTRLRLHS